MSRNPIDHSTQSPASLDYFYLELFRHLRLIRYYRNTIGKIVIDNTIQMILYKKVCLDLDD